MSSIPPISNNIPFHVAQAYGLQGPSKSGATQQAPAAAQAAAVGANLGPAAKLPSAAQKLVGARVPGKVDFSGDSPTQVSGGASSSSLQMYRHPADRNVAATAVSLGKSLDITG